MYEYNDDMFRLNLIISQEGRGSTKLEFNHRIVQIIIKVTRYVYMGQKFNESNIVFLQL
jgi:hypothetical protein